MKALVATRDVPGRARPLDRAVLCAAELRADRGSGRAGARGRARAAASTTAISATNPPTRSASPRRSTRRSRSGARRGCRSISRHIKALGVDVQGQAPAIIAKIEAARRAGQTVTADQYPWSASGTSLVASLVPLWAQDGGRDRRCSSASTMPRWRPGCASDMAENLRKRGGADDAADHRGRVRRTGRSPQVADAARRRSRRRGDRGDPRRRSRRRLVQPERGRHRGVHAPALGDDRLRRLERPPARLWQLRAQIRQICRWPSAC